MTSTEKELLSYIEDMAGHLERVGESLDNPIMARAMLGVLANNARTLVHVQRGIDAAFASAIAIVRKESQ